MAAQSIIDVLRDNGFLRPDAVLTADDEMALGRLSMEDIQALITIKEKLGVEFWTRHMPPRVDLIF
jgi:hypothetical protein